MGELLPSDNKKVKVGGALSRKVFKSAKTKLQVIIHCTKCREKNYFVLSGCVRRNCEIATFEGKPSFHDILAVTHLDSLGNSLLRLLFLSNQPETCNL